MTVSKPSFRLPDEYVQIALGLELPEVELDGVSVEEARLLSEAGLAAMRAVKGTAEQPAWFERYEYLIETCGWPWRQAVYIAWASMPKKGREPKTQEELAQTYLRLSSDRAISAWRKKNPAIDTTIAVLQSYELWEHRADAFQNLVSGMQNAGGDYKFFNHLKLFLEMTGDYVPTAKLNAVLKRSKGSGTTALDEETIDALTQGLDELDGEEGQA